MKNTLKVLAICGLIVTLSTTTLVCPEKLVCLEQEATFIKQSKKLIKQVQLITKDENKSRLKKMKDDESVFKNKLNKIFSENKDVFAKLIFIGYFCGIMLSIPLNLFKLNHLHWQIEIAVIAYLCLWSRVKLSEYIKLK